MGWGERVGESVGVWGKVKKTLVCRERWTGACELDISY